MAGLSCFYRTWLIWRTTMPYRCQGGVRATSKSPDEQSTHFPPFFALSCLTRDGYYYRGGNSRQDHLRIRAPLSQAGLLQVRCRRADATKHRFLVDCSSPASLPLVRPTPSRQRLRRPQKALALPSPACLSHRLALPMLCSAVQQQRKRRKVRGNECNAPPAGRNRATNIVSGCTLPPRRCITHCRPRAIRSRHSRFLTVQNTEFSLERTLDGAQVAIGDFSGHGLWGPHFSSQAHPPRLPGSPLAFPRASAAQSKQAYLAPRPVRVSLRSTENQGRIPSVNNWCGASTLSFCCFAHSGRPRDRNDSCGNPLMPV